MIQAVPPAPILSISSWKVLRWKILAWDSPEQMPVWVGNTTKTGPLNGLILYKKAASYAKHVKLPVQLLLIPQRLLWSGLSDPYHLLPCFGGKRCLSFVLKSPCVAEGGASWFQVYLKVSCTAPEGCCGEAGGWPSKLAGGGGHFYTALQSSVVQLYSCLFDLNLMCWLAPS